MELTNYSYKAHNELGKTVSGKIEAPDRETALIRLKRKYPIVVSVEEPGFLSEIMNLNIGSRKIKAKKLAILCNEFAIMLRSGVPIQRATALLSDNKDKKIRKLLSVVAEDLTAGKPLSNSFERHGREALSPTFFETIRAGEASGDLEGSFESLAKYYDDRSKLSSKIKAALFYPCLVMVLAVIVVIVMMIKVIPELANTFKDFGSDLPFMTRALVDVSAFFQNYWWVILIILAALVAGYKLLRKNLNARIEIDRLKLKVPIIGGFLKTNCSAQFSNTLSMLLHAGVKMQEALEITSRTIKNAYYAKATKELSVAIKAGRSLSKTMEKYPGFPPILSQMVAVGEETGELEETLKTIGRWYTEESDRKAQLLASKLEPIMLIGVGVIVALILFSIYIPLFEIYDLF